ncbi:hypothetical protein VV99796_03498 [Vibrio vulnificus]|uniref:hypothetical protein n=1 Tax=Vibrio vulnificus TaxID=672 RepID=UPI0009290C00|nr:hypothetical protein [Vibrio vulnificus]EHT4943464.1 hypothetical protein [Vibrio vulnificus]OJI21891.1 hypothetical protein VV99796_03498 [Vibrio vulnificus]OJI46774.1 hypothetical protein VVS316_03019 [Vibrio vulnificus]POB07828.1 hypothetical protein CRN33_06475 [Vibrio vulnificus]
MNSIISDNDVKMISDINNLLVEKYGLPIIEEGLVSWYFIYDENSIPVAGIALAEVSEGSYPFIVEGVNLDSLITISSADTRELTNFFSFRENRWLLDLLELGHAALSDLENTSIKNVILFTPRPIYRFLSIKQGFNISFIRPSRKEIDVPTAVTRLKERYGTKLEYEAEKNYLVRHRPRGVTFSVEQALASLREKK